MRGAGRAPSASGRARARRARPSLPPSLPPPRPAGRHRPRPAPAQKMASPCGRQQCSIQRRGVRHQLDSWRHKLIHCVGEGRRRGGEAGLGPAAAGGSAEAGAVRRAAPRPAGPPRSPSPPAAVRRRAGAGPALRRSGGAGRGVLPCPFVRPLSAPRPLLPARPRPLQTCLRRGRARRRGAAHLSLARGEPGPARLPPARRGGRERGRGAGGRSGGGGGKLWIAVPD